MGRDFLAQQRYVFDRSKWRKVNARYHGITRSMIPDAPWTVLKLLRVGGFEAYLVGGCVRDLLLNKAPKDFDVITTANLQQIKKKFHRAKIVGRRFPICIVLVKGSVIEVSSFETSAQQCQEKEKALLSKMRGSCDEKDFLLWKNSMQRDFTINSLFFDPFMNRIYDYANGMEDLRSLKLKTLIPARLSFQEDCARILRGIRIAGRLGLSISKDTETAICILQSSVKSLNKDRIKMELNYMLSYGAAESTILLLQRFQLLKFFLPFHAAYLHNQADEVSAHDSTMLMKLLYSLDKMVSSDQPCDCSLWVGLLAFHQALVLNPQNAFVIWAFASMLYCGTWQEGVKFARENAKVEGRFVPEISGFSEIKSDEKLAEEVSQLASLVQDAVDAFTDEISLSESLTRYLDPPFDVCVFVSKKIGEHVARLFHMQSCEYRREIFKIDYDLLVKGDLDETRFVMGKVILKTLSGGHVRGKEIIKEELKVIKENHEPILSELAKDGCVVKKVKEHILLSFDEQKIEKAKQKQKVKLKCSSEQNINSMKEEVVLKDAHMEIAKKQLEVVDTMHVSEEKICSPLQESDKKQVAVGNEKRQHRAKKHRKKVEKVKHHELCYKETINIMKDEVVLKEIAKKHRKVVDTTQVSEEKFRSPLQESDKKQVAVGNEERQHSTKKHRKMVEKVKHHELCYKETINSMKEEVVLKDVHMEIAKKQQKVVGTTQVSEEIFHSPLLESDKKQLSVGNEEHQHRAKKYRKMVEKVKHQEFCYKETKEPFNVIRKCNPSEDEKIKGGEKKDGPPVLQEMVKVKSVQSCLSSLFK
ncbi:POLYNUCLEOTIDE ADENYLYLTRANSFERASE FAMILY PROTEIN [Salix koriyanagi]|uniref:POLYNUCLEOTIDE ADENYLYLTRANSFERASE FAMILY PROTEIN n=1 Tax=Salix koriyanagi TaxID=2511006 RepID=A0A9Q0SLN6_9ROSI|nr:POLYNUCLEOTIDE ADENYLYLTRANSFERASE FAMILY PROTEIN [Salix koriyanagi]